MSSMYSLYTSALVVIQRMPLREGAFHVDADSISWIVGIGKPLHPPYSWQSYQTRVVQVHPHQDSQLNQLDLRACLNGILRYDCSIGFEKRIPALKSRTMDVDTCMDGHDSCSGHRGCVWFRTQFADIDRRCMGTWKGDSRKNPWALNNSSHLCDCYWGK